MAETRLCWMNVHVTEVQAELGIQGLIQCMVEHV